MGEVTVSTKGGPALLISQGRLDELGLRPGAQYELVKAKQGVWVLLEKERPKLDMEIFALLGKKNLQERVEGTFEKLLGKEELKRFREMLKEGSIVAFKLGPQYKKAVYKTKEEIEKNIKIGKRGKAEKGLAKKESELASTMKKSPEEYSLEKDGFLVCKNANKAKALSLQLGKEIKEGKVRGIKSFDGSYYIAENALYQKYKQKLLSLIKAENGINSEKLAENAGISRLLAKIACEFMKDEGEIIEKRKDSFQAI